MRTELLPVSIQERSVTREHKFTAFSVSLNQKVVSITLPGHGELTESQRAQLLGLVRYLESEMSALKSRYYTQYDTYNDAMMEILARLGVSTSDTTGIDVI